MAVLAKYRDDIAGAITTGGTSTAYTVTSYSSFTSLALLNGQMISFTPHATNGASPTLNVDGLGAKTIGLDINTAVPAATLIAGTPYTAIYSSALGIFVLKGFYQVPYIVPIGGVVPYFGATSPNSNFVIPLAQAINRTTYATLFGLIGTTYGVGDGSTTFNVPDMGGRVVAGKEAVASRLTTAKVGIDGGTLGATGGGTQTLVTANLPAYTPAGTIGNVIAGTVTLANANGGANNGLVRGDSIGTNAIPAYVSPTVTSTFTGTAQGGLSTPVNTAQHTIICNYLLRVI